jgi:hypothetical protein
MRVADEPSRVTGVTHYVTSGDLLLFAENIARMMDENEPEVLDFAVG